MSVLFILTITRDHVFCLTKRKLNSDGPITGSKPADSRPCHQLDVNSALSQRDIQLSVAWKTGNSFSHTQRRLEAASCVWQEGWRKSYGWGFLRF